MKKVRKEGGDLYLALLALRTRPQFNQLPPSMMLMNRHLRTLLPSSAKLHYDKTARDLNPLSIGQNVRLYQNNSWSRLGTIIQVGPEIRSYRISTDKDTIVR